MPAAVVHVIAQYCENNTGVAALVTQNPDARAFLLTREMKALEKELALHDEDHRKSYERFVFELRGNRMRYNDELIIPVREQQNPSWLANPALMPSDAQMMGWGECE